MRVDERYSGFPGRALGGYVAGLLARSIASRDAIEVRLERPVALGDELAVDRDALVRDGARVASARTTTIDLRPPRLIGAAEAEAASAAYFGAKHHFFGTCFCCGPARARGDGLRIFPSAVGGGVVAALWRPADAIDALVAPAEIVWSALDCPGIWAQVLVTTGTAERAVTGSIAVVQLAPIVARESHVVLGWPLAREGRKIRVGAAITSERGAVLAVALQTLIVTEQGVPLDREVWEEAPANDRRGLPHLRGCGTP